MARRKRSSAEQPIGVGLTTKQMKRKKPINLDYLIDIEPITENQKLLFKYYDEGKNIFAHGVPGSGKTFCLLYKALKDVLDERTPYEKIYIVRSLVQTREIGFLPGPQPLDAKILTPSGWTTMGKLKVGDYVFGRNGNPTKVLGVYPKGEKLVYKITTTENTSTECCEDHLWMTKTFEDKKRQRSGSVKTTKEIIDTLHNKKGKINHYIPRNDAIKFPKKDLPLPPYLLGAILGDGSISGSISIANTDYELIERIRSEISQFDCHLQSPIKTENNVQYTISTNKLKCNKPAKRIILEDVITKEKIEYYSIGDAVKELNLTKYEITQRCKNNKIVDNYQYKFLPSLNRWQNPVKDRLHKLGLEGKKSFDKFIPEIYKYSSIEDRIDLLRGLMDTDGTIKDVNGGSSSFTTISEQLAKDMVELVQSLGGRATYRVRDRTKEGIKKIVIDKNGNERLIITKHISYELNISLPIHINPFYISRKASRFNPKYMHCVGIKSIEPICKKEVQCILVEDQEHLYITDQYIVTHNTETDKKSLFEIPYKNMVKYMFQMPSDADFEMLYGNLKSQDTISFWCTSFIRGITLDNCIIIVDEAQNCSAHESFSVISRCGEDTKIMFSGDIEQSDLTKVSERTGIIDFIRVIEAMPSFEKLEFGVDDIVRSTLVKEFIIAKKSLNL
jgi:intein/homing endonuclease